MISKVAVVGFPVVIVVVALGILVSDSEAGKLAIDDEDCKGMRDRGPHDEPIDGCYRHCGSVPAWYWSGHRTVCWYDDEPPEPEADS